MKFYYTSIAPFCVPLAPKIGKEEKKQKEILIIG